MEQIRRIVRPTDVPDTGLLCDLLWSDPDKEVKVKSLIGRLKCLRNDFNNKIYIRFLFCSQDWGENDRGVSFTFGADVVSRFLRMHDLELICRGHQVNKIDNQKKTQIQILTHFQHFSLHSGR